MDDQHRHRCASDAITVAMGCLICRHRSQQRRRPAAGDSVGTTCNPDMPPAAEQLRLPTCAYPHATGSVSCMHIVKVGAIPSITHAMLSMHPATCTQRPVTATPKACCMQTQASLSGSLTFRPISSCLSKRFQQRNVVQNRSRSSRRISAVQQEQEELPPWARKEKERELAALEKDLPFGVYLLGSAIVAIAATGSWFELQNKNAIFGVLGPDNPLWGIILGFFGVSGFPTSGYLFYRAIQSANKASERADKADGY